MDKETEDKIKDLEDRIKTLEGKRILQMDIMPQVIKSRHLDSVEMGLYSLDVNGFKRIGIGGLDTYLYRYMAGELRTNSVFVSEQDIIAVGTGIGGLRIYTTSKPLLLSGTSDGSYDCNLYAVSTDTLATADDLKFMTATKGPIIIDRATATVYRIKSTNGTLGVEAV